MGQTDRQTDRKGENDGKNEDKKREEVVTNCICVLVFVCTVCASMSLSAGIMILKQVSVNSF